MHCLKSVQIRSFFWFVFSRIRTDTENTAKYGQGKTPYLDTFHESMAEEETFLNYKPTDICLRGVLGIPNFRMKTKFQVLLL